MNGSMVATVAALVPDARRVVLELVRAAGGAVAGPPAVEARRPRLARRIDVGSLHPAANGIAWQREGRRFALRLP